MQFDRPDLLNPDGRKRNVLAMRFGMKILNDLQDILIDILAVGAIDFYLIYLR